MDIWTYDELVEDYGEVLKEGILEKQCSTGLSKWEKWVFRLHETGLVYTHVKDSLMKAKWGASDDRCIALDDILYVKSAGKTFNLLSTTKPIKLRARTDDDAQEWVEDIKEAMAEHKFEEQAPTSKLPAWLQKAGAILDKKDEPKAKKVFNDVLKGAAKAAPKAEPKAQPKAAVPPLSIPEAKPSNAAYPENRSNDVKAGQHDPKDPGSSNAVGADLRASDPQPRTSNHSGGSAASNISTPPPRRTVMGAQAALDGKKGVWNPPPAPAATEGEKESAFERPIDAAMALPPTRQNIIAAQNKLDQDRGVAPTFRAVDGRGSEVKGVRINLATPPPRWVVMQAQRALDNQRGVAGIVAPPRTALFAAQNKLDQERGVAAPVKEQKFSFWNKEKKEEKAVKEEMPVVTEEPPAEESERDKKKREKRDRRKKHDPEPVPEETAPPVEDDPMAAMAMMGGGFDLLSADVEPAAEPEPPEPEDGREAAKKKREAARARRRQRKAHGGDDEEHHEEEEPTSAPTEGKAEARRRKRRGGDEEHHEEPKPAEEEIDMGALAAFGFPDVDQE